MRLLDGENNEWLRSPENRLLFELYVAYLEARKGGKRKTYDEHKYEVFEFDHLIGLRDSILDKTYTPSRSTAHIIHNPVIREIFSAPFRDRVVHHFIYNNVCDWWDRHFIYDSYSCREGKGTLFGVKRLARQIQSASDNYEHEVWVAKLDIQGYFMSLPRKELYNRAIWGLEHQFNGEHDWRYELIRFLWGQIILDDPVKGARLKGWPDDWADLPDSKSLLKQPSGIGIVIGNLTSQLLSNIYLDQLDRYIKKELGWKYYGRYVDDSFIVMREEEVERFKGDIKNIEDFLRRIGLTLHPNKRSLQPASNGVDFLGSVIYPGRIFPGKRIIRNAGRAFSEVVEGVRDVKSGVSY